MLSRYLWSSRPLIFSMMIKWTMDPPCEKPRTPSKGPYLSKRSDVFLRLDLKSSGSVSDLYSNQEQSVAFQVRLVTASSTREGLTVLNPSMNMQSAQGERSLLMCFICILKKSPLVPNPWKQAILTFLFIIQSGDDVTVPTNYPPVKSDPTTLTVQTTKVKFLPRQTSSKQTFGALPARAQGHWGKVDLGRSDLVLLVYLSSNYYYQPMMELPFRSCQEATTLKLSQYELLARQVQSSNRESLEQRVTYLIRDGETSQSVVKFVMEECIQKEELIQRMAEIIMSCSDIVSQWMQKYSVLLVQVQTYEELKEAEETQLKSSIDKYSSTIRKLASQNHSLEVEVNEISSMKDHFRKLYEEQLDVKSATDFLLPTFSNLDLNEKEHEKSRGTEDDNWVLEELKDLRRENQDLKMELEELKRAQYKVPDNEDFGDLNLNTQMSLLEDPSVLKTQRSAMSRECRDTLAVELLGMGSRISQNLQDFGGFSQMFAKQNKESTGSVYQLKVPQRVLRRYQTTPATETEPLLFRLLRGILDRFVAQRIRRHLL